MTRFGVAASGEPAPPARRAFWSAVFDGPDLPGDAVPTPGGGPIDLVDAAFLAQATGGGDIYRRGDRLDQVSFGQRVFPEASQKAPAQAVSALRALPDRRMLMWSLERMGIRASSVYVDAARLADEAASGDPDRAFWTLAQLQGALALVARMTDAGTFGPEAAARLVQSLSAVPIMRGNRYGGAIGRWIERELLPRLPPAEGPEAQLIAGLSGPPAGGSSPQVMWEGQAYRVDFAAAESRRLQAVRQKQHGYPLALAFELIRLSDQLLSPQLTARVVNDVAAAIGQAVATSVPATSRSEAQVLAPGVRSPRPVREALQRIVDDLSDAGVGREPLRARGLAPQLADVADLVLSEALLSIVYAADLGPPDGAALLASNVALRHDFGLAIQDGRARARRAWDVPRQELLPGAPWRVTGSLMGLDLALGRMALPRHDVDRVAAPPRLPPNEREAFPVGVALMRPGDLRDDDRRQIAAAIARGGERVAAMASRADLDGIAEAIGLDGWRRRALAWTIAKRPAAVPEMFSLAELLALGGQPAGVDLDAWGTLAISSHGCPCTRLLAAGSWSLLAGRPQMALMASFVADLNLRVAVALDELRLPASLARPVLGAAVQDFIYDASPSDPGDWLALVRSARALSRLRIEDYVAAAAAVYGPLVPIGNDGVGASQ
jgi:hypothetical protein